jgi:hypothetical protein
LNQNRNSNRRRGRGGNRGQGGGGGNMGNRIDSRARGNAPQLLEKYRKMAHDASLNGDRVLTEYYLQFADHYFRVVADSRQQRDDQRPRREFDQNQPYDGDDYDSDERGGDNRDRSGREDDDRSDSEEPQRGSEGDDVDEGSDANPFTRDTRGDGERDRERSRERPNGRGRGRGRPANDAADERPDEPADSSFDPGLLPPSIARDEREEEPAPRPARTRTRRTRPADDAGDGEALEAAS